MTGGTSEVLVTTPSTGSFLKPPLSPGQVNVRLQKRYPRVPLAMVTEGESRPLVPGDDWTGATCRNVRTPKGPCWFCGRIVWRAGGYMASFEGRRAHYTCAPGLGIAALPAEQNAHDEDFVFTVLSPEDNEASRQRLGPFGSNGEILDYGPGHPLFDAGRPLRDCPPEAPARVSSSEVSPMFLLKITERDTGGVVYDISILEGQDVTTDPAEATQRSEIISNIRAGLLLERVGSEFIVEVVPAPAESGGRTAEGEGPLPHGDRRPEGQEPVTPSGLDERWPPEPSHG